MIAVDEIYKRAFREIYCHAVKGLNESDYAWIMPDLCLQIAELFVKKADRVWVRNFDLKPIDANQLSDPQTAFLEICRLCYPDQDYDLRKICLNCRDVAARFVSDAEKIEGIELIGLEGFVYLVGRTRKQLEGFGLSNEDVETELRYWEDRLGKSPEEWTTE